MVHYSEQRVRAQVKLHDAEWLDREHSLETVKPYDAKQLVRARSLVTYKFHDA